MTGEIAVALIIRQDENDIWLPAREGTGEDKSGGAEEEKEAVEHLN